ncbi:hypothetical protein [Azospirillum sp. TSO5]|uniref:hypothetical protein n=1 Tax=Azospirillum sp. TSO5 TaxID=716760 RepID=UPI000D61D85C|nr:hypothetical protein [Azospirillum sp. TSO5]PWC96925.1 hypothetical protein TSO5_05700 [Azospirillum sp. TSO5]
MTTSNNFIYAAPDRTERDAAMRRDALALKSIVDDAIAAGRATIRTISPVDVENYDRLIAGIRFAEDSARSKRGHIGAKRPANRKALAWKNGVSA